MREQYDDVLESEQLAARDARNRLRSLRERFLEAEGRSETAIIHGTDGQVYRGTVETVGSDHVLLRDSNRELFVAIALVVGVEFH
jgi:hypothetical protein